MARVAVTRRTKVLKLVRREIVCSGCGKPSGYVGPVLIAKWKGRKWYCRNCGFKHQRNKLQPLCVCGHRKYRHANGKGRCDKRFLDLERKPHPFTELSNEEVNKLDDDAYQRYSEARRRHTRELKHVFHCECKHYTPVKEAKLEVEHA